MASISSISTVVEPRLSAPDGKLLSRRAEQGSPEQAVAASAATPRQGPPPPVLLGTGPAVGPDPSIEEMEQIVARMRQAIGQAGSDRLEVAFRQDQRAGGFVIEIRNADGELVRQFPPEKVLNLRGKMDELSGMVIDELT